ncbi:hypothetical protein BD309DRAFT_396803 [Dichomitus squalens]|nr:hypothetical protein BD309DRAFT_396803 [Dichomitus squalens]
MQARHRLPRHMSHHSLPCFPCVVHCCRLYARSMRGPGTGPPASSLHMRMYTFGPSSSPIMPSLSLPDMLTANSDATTPLAQLLHLPTLDETYGALLLGSFMYKDDHLVNKLTVLSLMSVFCGTQHSSYFSSYSDPLALLYGIWSIQCQPLLAGLAVLVSQSFFARRVYIISEKYRFLVVISLLLTFVTFGFSIGRCSYHSNSDTLTEGNVWGRPFQPEQ